MKRNAFVLTALLGGAVIGCSEPMSIIRMPDGGGTDGGGGACMNGQWQCVPGSQMARQCDGRGGFSAQVDCSAQGAGRTCINGIGCAVCTPNMARCKDGDLNTTQQCAPDGSGWVDGATCDMANGEYCRAGVCVTRCGDLGNSYLGCDYWPTVTSNPVDRRFSFAVAVANPNTYDVNVRIEGGALTTPRERIVAAGRVQQIELPWVSRLSNNATDTTPATSARVAGGAYRLRSNGPVAVYQFSPLQFQRVPGVNTGDNFSYTNDASLLLPQNVLANQYIVVGTSNGPSTWDTPFYSGSFVSIVGAQNEGTNSVSVRLTAPVIDPANPTRMLPVGEHRFDLDRGEVLQLIMPDVRGELTGTLINASAPVAVFSGNHCTSVPLTQAACDHVEEQLFPTTTWGRTYAVTPFRDRPTNVAHLIRIVAQRDGVTLTFDGIAAPSACNRMLNQGQFCEFETMTPFQVTGSQPIMVAQFMRGLGNNPVCGCAGGICARRPDCVADPAMVLEVPTDQYRANYNFLIPDSYEQNYINVIAPRGAMVTLDGNMLMGTPVNVGSNLVVYYLNVPAGAHELKTMTNVERVGLKVYGVASFTSYAFPGGLDLAPISPPG